MPNTTEWRVLVVDDEIARTREIQEYFRVASDDHGDVFDVIPCNDFQLGLEMLRSQHFDLVVLDLRRGTEDLDGDESQAGLKLLQDIRSQKFCPVVFYTGLPHLVRPLESTLVRVVEKSEGAIRVHAVCCEILATGTPALNKSLDSYLDSVRARYMWDFVVPNWERIQPELDRSALAYLLSRRLAMLLSTEAVPNLAAELGVSPAGASNEPPKTHPMQFYIMPPMEDGLRRTGDIVRQADGTYKMLLTPTCDMRNGKADRYLWASCFDLAQCEEYVKWRGASGTGSDKELCTVFKNRRSKQPERYFYLPGVSCVPDLVVDLQNLTTTTEALGPSAQCIASLDSPYVESLVAQFIRQYSRVGTPNLTHSIVLDRLRQSLQSPGAEQM